MTGYKLKQTDFKNWLTDYKLKLIDHKLTDYIQIAWLQMDLQISHWFEPEPALNLTFILINLLTSLQIETDSLTTSISHTDLNLP